MPELTMAEMGYKKHLKVELFPTIWCPGCGIGTIMMQLAIVLEEMSLDETNTVIVTGIGCTGRMGSYLKHESVYTLHGRTLPVAEAIKRFPKKGRVPDPRYASYVPRLLEDLRARFK